MAGTSHPIPAVQYLRMSTEHQRYSLENQAAAIRDFAAAQGYRIIGTYADPGRSGLTLEGRPALKRLLADALRPDCGFSAVLVLDVSRWGRFQDPDQSAHYEFLCRAAGAPVVYCDEAFENDGSLTATVIKHLKRVMAAEYSRELSERVHRAQIQQARLGFKQGGARAYGVRRVLVGPDGQMRRELRDGERKALHDERVMLVRGPPEEVQTVRRIFRLYTREGWSLPAIARRLNAEGVPASLGARWSYWRVRSVLSSELALGAYVFNRSSQRMRSQSRSNPPERWVRVRVMDPIVSAATFQAAQRRLANATRFSLPEGRMLDALKRLLREEGHLSDRLIDSCAYAPHSATYRKRFGSLRRAYALAGFSPSSRWRLSGVKPAGEDELLHLLRALHARKGYVTAKLVNADPETPSVEVYVARFGSLLQAYARAGLPSDPSALLSQGQSRRSRRNGPSRLTKPGGRPTPADLADPPA